MTLFIPSFICVLLLIIHSYVFRGWRITLAFFGLCYVLKVLKCMGDSNPVTRDYFPLTEFLPQLTYKGIPYGSYLFVIPVGWIFAHYIGWCIAEAIVRNNPKKRDALFPISVLSILGTGLIGICMEKINEGVGWWRWEPHVQTNIAQYFSVWTLWSIMFYYFFFMLFIEEPKQRALNRIAAAYSLIFIGALCFYIGISKQIAVLVWFLLWSIVFCCLFFILYNKRLKRRTQDVSTAIFIIVFFVSSWIYSLVLKQVVVLFWFLIWTIMLYYLFFLIFIREPKQRALNLSAIIYLIIFFVSIYLYALIFKQSIMLVWLFLILGQIPLYFIDAVKLRPMRKEDMESPKVAATIGVK